MTEVFELDPKSKSFNMAESACCIAFPETEGIGLSSPFFLQIDTFGKLLRYLTNVCYLKLKKLRYLSKLRSSESGGASELNTIHVIYFRKALGKSI